MWINLKWRWYNCCSRVFDQVFRSKIEGQGHMSHWNFWPCLLCGSLPIGQILFKFDMNTSHGEMICYKQFSGQNVKVTWVIQSFCHVGFFLTSLWLFDYFMDLLHLWHKHKSWGDYVMQTISHSKGQWSRSLRLFKFLLCLLYGLFHGYGSYVAQIQHEVMMCHVQFAGQKHRGKQVNK